MGAASPPVAESPLRADSGRTIGAGMGLGQDASIRGQLLQCVYHVGHTRSDRTGRQSLWLGTCAARRARRCWFDTPAVTFGWRGSVGVAGALFPAERVGLLTLVPRTEQTRSTMGRYACLKYRVGSHVLKWECVLSVACAASYKGVATCACAAVGALVVPMRDGQCSRSSHVGIIRATREKRVVSVATSRRRGLRL